MKNIPAICMLFLFVSCYNGNEQTQQLNERVNRLEQQLDSLTGKQQDYAGPVNSSSSNSKAVISGNCLAKTKKGLQCKRKAKSNGYCWQHGK